MCLFLKPADKAAQINPAPQMFKILGFKKLLFTYYYYRGHSDYIVLYIIIYCCREYAANKEQ